MNVNTPSCKLWTISESLLKAQRGLLLRLIGWPEQSASVVWHSNDLTLYALQFYMFIGGDGEISALYVGCGKQL
jgi:hypothetical protein